MIIFGAKGEEQRERLRRNTVLDFLVFYIEWLVWPKVVWFVIGSEESSQQTYQNNAAMELINSVTGADEESQSRQRILTYAARRYA